jgi:hypothetical protein
MDLRKNPEIGFAAQFDSPVTIVPELPPDLLDTSSIQALTTVAALMSRPNVAGAATSGEQLTSEESLAVRLLALYTAGGMLDLSKEQFRTLDDRAAKFVQTCGNAELAAYAAFVRRRAYELTRHRGVVGRRRSGDAPSVQSADGKISGWLSTPVPGKAERYRKYMHEVDPEIFWGHLYLPPEEARNVTGLARIDLDSGRGYGNVEVGLSPMFELHPRYMQLLTIAGVFAAAKPSCCNTSAEAIVMLALYAAGARMLLTKQQFRTLEDRARKYASTMQFGRYRRYGNRDFAMKALFFARLRARRTGVLPSGGRKKRSPKTA